MQDVIAYFSTHGTDYIQMVLEHLNVSILSLAVAILVAVPLGIVCSRSPLLEKISVGVSGILRIIPSLAVLVVCVPILGTGVLPAVVALTILAIPPILINTALGARRCPRGSAWHGNGRTFGFLQNQGAAGVFRVLCGRPHCGV